jgi:ubiquinone/menaquinone biosynthesis C-methylase UbiE
MTTTDRDLMQLYDRYYVDGAVESKRAATARQTRNHIRSITNGREYESILDIGAGDGAVLEQIAKCGIGKSLSAVEISTSGLDAIRKRSIASLKGLHQFDGYNIPFPDKSFDLGLAVHVVEHVEHERMFLREAARVCRQIYVEVPLEHTRDVRRSIRISGPYGHINFYTPHTFENLLKTAGLQVDNFIVFPHDLEFEQFMSGVGIGWAKYQIRAGLLRIAPMLATRTLVYMAGALCSQKA